MSLILRDSDRLLKLAQLKKSIVAKYGSGLLTTPLNETEQTIFKDDSEEEKSRKLTENKEIYAKRAAELKQGEPELIQELERIIERIKNTRPDIRDALHQFEGVVSACLVMAYDELSATMSLDCVTRSDVITQDIRGMNDSNVGVILPHSEVTVDAATYTVPDCTLSMCNLDQVKVWLQEVAKEDNNISSNSSDNVEVSVEFGKVLFDYVKSVLHEGGPVVNRFASGVPNNGTLSSTKTFTAGHLLLSCHVVTLLTQYNSHRQLYGTTAPLTHSALSNVISLFCEAFDRRISYDSMKPTVYTHVEKKKIKVPCLCKEECSTSDLDLSEISHYINASSYYINASSHSSRRSTIISDNEDCIVSTGSNSQTNKSLYDGYQSFVQQLSQEVQELYPVEETGYDVRDSEFEPSEKDYEEAAIKYGNNFIESKLYEILKKHFNNEALNAAVNGAVTEINDFVQQLVDLPKEGKFDSLFDTAVNCDTLKEAIDILSTKVCDIDRYVKYMNLLITKENANTSLAMFAYSYIPPRIENQIRMNEYRCNMTKEEKRGVMQYCKLDSTMLRKQIISNVFKSDEKVYSEYVEMFRGYLEQLRKALVHCLDYKYAPMEEVKHYQKLKILILKAMIDELRRLMELGLVNDDIEQVQVYRGSQLPLKFKTEILSGEEVEVKGFTDILISRHIMSHGKAISKHDQVQILKKIVSHNETKRYASKHLDQGITHYKCRDQLHAENTAILSMNSMHNEPDDVDRNCALGVLDDLFITVLAFSQLNNKNKVIHRTTARSTDELDFVLYHLLMIVGVDTVNIGKLLTKVDKESTGNTPNSNNGPGADVNHDSNTDSSSSGAGGGAGGGTGSGAGSGSSSTSGTTGNTASFSGGQGFNYNLTELDFTTHVNTERNAKSNCSSFRNSQVNFKSQTHRMKNDRKSVTFVADGKENFSCSKSVMKTSSSSNTQDYCNKMRAI